MARIKEYHGEIRYQDERGRIYFGLTWVLDCGCTVVVDKRSATLMDRRESLENLVSQTVVAHDCRVVVRPSGQPIRRRLEDTENQYQKLREETTRDVMRYMGMGVRIDPGLKSNEMWFDPWKKEPPKPIAQAANPLGFTMPKQLEIKTPEPKKKPDPPRALTRWDLIEID